MKILWHYQQIQLLIIIKKFIVVYNITIIIKIILCYKVKKLKKLNLNNFEKHKL